VTPVARLAPPVLRRYVLGECLRLFGLCMLGFVLIYVLVDFFDNLDTFLKYQASLGAVLRHFVFKIPLILGQLVPVATLASVLLGLGVMARHNEITALRASGVSTLQIGGPLLIGAALLGLAMLAWNEVVVPYSAARSRQIEYVEIRKKPLKALLSDHGIWFHGSAGIYSIEHIDARSGRLMGLTVYDFEEGFELRRLIEIPSATWEGDHWTLERATERTFDPAGNVETRELEPGAFVLRDEPQEFRVLDKDAEELSFLRLRRHIHELSRKGIDTTEPRVDLYLKLALPFVPLVMTLVAIPLASRNPRRRPLAASVGVGLIVGFSYWVLLAFSISLGHGGAIPPLLAAWTANGVFVVLGAFLFLGPE
jgi:lipopolysaccharide export system permease protein